nr:hypothetical protein [Tanacetum cinerariifolium]
MGLYLGPVGWIPPSLTPQYSFHTIFNVEKMKCNLSWKQQPATIVATIFMAIATSFKKMKHESVALFDQGYMKYWLIVWFNVITWQLCFMGTKGMVFLTTLLTGGICMMALMAMNVLAGVLVYGDDFKGPKLCFMGTKGMVFLTTLLTGGICMMALMAMNVLDGVLVYGDDFKGPKVVSTLLCLWAFCSFVYGIYGKMKRDMIMKGANNVVHGNDNVDDDDDKKQQKNSLIELNEIVTEDQR